MLKINHSLSLLAALIGLLPINHVFSDVGLAPQSAPAAQRVVASSADQSQRRAELHPVQINPNAGRSGLR